MTGTSNPATTFVAWQQYPTAFDPVVPKIGAASPRLQTGLLSTTFTLILSASALSSGTGAIGLLSAAKGDRVARARLVRQVQRAQRERQAQLDQLEMWELLAPPVLRALQAQMGPLQQLEQPDQQDPQEPQVQRGQQV